MFIPPGKVSEITRFNATSTVYLEKQHVCIKSDIVEIIFGAEEVVLMYYADTILTAAPVSNQEFKHLYKAEQQILKSKNLSGDKAIAIHGLLMDNDRDITDRNLNFEVDIVNKIITIKI